MALEVPGSKNLLQLNQEIITRLRNTFGENVKEGISQNIAQTGIASLQKANQILGSRMLSSCFHPNDFPMSAYRLTSLINMLEICQELELKPQVEYLDSLLTLITITGFPNIPSKKGESNALKQVGNILKKVGGVLGQFEENTQNGDAGGQVEENIQSGDVGGQVEENTQNGITNRINVIIDGIKEGDKLLQNLLNHANLKQIPNRQCIDFINSILQDVNISEELEKFCQEKGLNINNINKFKGFIFEANITEVLTAIQQLFCGKMLQTKYRGKSISEMEKHAELQNTLLTLIFERIIPEQQEKIKELGIMTTNDSQTNAKFRNRGIDIPLSYNETENVNNFTSVLQKVFNDPLLGSEFFETYFRNFFTKTKGQEIPLFSYGENGREFNVVANKSKNDTIIYSIRRTNNDGEEITSEEFFHLLCGGAHNINFQGVISLLVSAISGMPHIGSERGIREIIAKSFEQHAKVKKFHNTEIQNYIEKTILGMGLFESMNHGENPEGKHLSGSCGTIPNDLIKLLFIGGNFARDQLTQAINNNKKIPEIHQETLFDSFKKPIDTTRNLILQITHQDTQKKLLDSFYRLHNLYQENKNINTFLELLYFCFEKKKFIENILKKQS